ncbi:hypothetical protein ACIGW0_14795 [Streptomyces bikiniensis]|uniref:Uncharacterized protein n=1 Tax=Streptomyces bikiniensis TaxID=1896 RepID=A0ABW8CV63_STRBI
MSVRTRSGTSTTATGADTLLPWWVLALPVAAFTALLLLMTGPGEAHATGGDPKVGRFLEQVRQTLPL